MSFSSRRRNYLLTPHRRDGLIEWMKSMLMHSFVLDALDTTAADTFTHFEMLIDEHRLLTSADSSADPQQQQQQQQQQMGAPSRLKQLVPTVGIFHTRLPLRRAFEAYNEKYALTKRKHICISFNELRHILNLAQMMAMRCPSKKPSPALALRGKGGGGRPDGSADTNDSSDDEEEDEDEDARAIQRWAKSPSMLSISDADIIAGRGTGGGGRMGPEPPPPLNLDESTGTPNTGTVAAAAPASNGSCLPSSTPFCGPKMITFDGDQTLYSDGANFESNPKLAYYLYLLLRNGVTVAVVTAAGYEYQTDKYEFRLSGLLAYFKERKLPVEDCERFYLFGGECNYLLHLGNDYKLHAVKERGPGGWLTSTSYLNESPANWDEASVTALLDIAEQSVRSSLQDQKLRGRVIRKKRAVGLIPKPDCEIPREALDETVLRVQAELRKGIPASAVELPFCAFNGGKDCWVDVGNKRVGVQILQSYLGIAPAETLHIGDQFLNTGNDYAARDVCPCIWITSPDETTYILKSILRLAGVSLGMPDGDYEPESDPQSSTTATEKDQEKKKAVDFEEIERRTTMVQLMDVYTGEMTSLPPPQSPAKKSHGGTG